MKDAMVERAREFQATIARHDLVTTGTIGRLLHSAAWLDVECLLSGPMGGDLQIGARLAVGGIDAGTFLRNPMRSLKSGGRRADERDPAGVVGPRPPVERIALEEGMRITAARCALRGPCDRENDGQQKSGLLWRCRLNLQRDAEECATEGLRRVSATSSNSFDCAGRSST